MLNEVILVKPTYFKETGNKQTFDKNGKPNVFLQPIAGNIPNTSMVLAGSVAIGNGILNTDGSIAGRGLQLVLVNETETDETFGRQFSVTVLDHDVDPTTVLDYRTKLGAGNVNVIAVPKAADGGGNAPVVNTSKVSATAPAGPVKS